MAAGNNVYGRLGYGDTYDRGDGDIQSGQLLGGEMGRNLSFVNLGIGKSVAFAAAGMYHTCAALRTPTSSSTINELKCWGIHALPTDPAARLNRALQACTLSEPWVEKGLHCWDTHGVLVSAHQHPG